MDDLLSIPKQNILIVDDNIANQKLSKRLVEKCGHFVVVAENGRVAVELFKEQKIDLIFMDCQMPIMDGFEATKEIRRIEKEASHKVEVPIIAFTAGVLSKNKNSSLDVGMNDFLPKPVTLKGFKASLTKWIRKDDQINYSQNKGQLHGGSFANLDKKYLESISVEDSKLSLVTRLSIFTSCVSKELRVIDECLEPLNFRKIEKSSYFIGEHASIIGAVKLRALANLVEKKCALKNYNGLFQDISQIDTELINVTKEFKSFFNL